MKKRGKSFSIVFACGMLMSLLTSCASSTYVYVQQDKYKPQFSAQDFRDYKGKSIVLNSFTNRAQNTSLFYYYSKDKKVCYEGSPSIQSYIWYCFKKAFMHVGVFVQGPQGGPFSATIVPEGMKLVEFELISLTDTNLEFNINLFKEIRMIYQKSFTITMPQSADQTPLSLENNAYKMMDEAFTAVLSDSGFKASFLK